MKTMKNFSAQQLSKSQMNNIKGGAAVFACATVKDDIKVQIFETTKQMVDYLQSNGGGECNHLYDL